MSPATSSFRRSLGDPDPGRYRHPRPSDPDMRSLVPIGAIIRTSYGTGGRVTELQPWTVKDDAGGDLQCWTIVYAGPGSAKERECWLNEYVVHEGRIRALFEANEDEVFVVSRPVGAEPEQLAFAFLLADAA